MSEEPVDVLIIGAGASGDAGPVAAVTAQCYYRDDRVMQSIGMEPQDRHRVGRNRP
ncbi:MAG: hypothetical protein WD767_08845 [Alphaproteobacteria bacterium]